MSAMDQPPPLVEDVVQALTLPITAASVVYRRGGSYGISPVEGKWLKLTFTGGGTVYVKAW